MIVRARFRIDLSGIFESSTPNVSMDASLNKTMSVEISLNKTMSMDVSLNKSISSDLDFMERDRSERSLFSESSVDVGSDEVVQQTGDTDDALVAENSIIETPSGSKETPHNNPNWLANLQKNFDNVIIQACSEATKAAVAANKKIEVIDDNNAMKRCQFLFCFFSALRSTRTLSMKL